MRSGLHRLIRRLQRAVSADLAFGAFIFLCGMAIGVAVIAVYGVGDFYREFFDVAVMSACGQGFERPVFADTPAAAAAGRTLASFLANPDGVFDCAVLEHVARTKPPIRFQLFMPYLLDAAILSWRVFGVSWNALAPLFGALCGSLLCGVYAIARLFSGRLISLGVVGLLGASSLHMFQLPRLRDYAKAPFLVVGIALIAYLTLGRLRPKARLWLAAALGLTAGIGFGFRIDVILLLPFFILCVPCFQPPGRPRSWRETALVLSAAIAVFLVAGWPMTRVYVQGGGNSWHFILLGLADEFNYALNIQADVYSVAEKYLDALVLGLVNAFAASADLPPAALFTAEYDEYGRNMYLTYASYFPADVIVRAYSAVIAILSLPRWMPTMAGIPIVVVALTFAIGAKVRAGVFATLVILYFGGTSSLQFGVRHHFYLEMIAVLSLAFVIQAAVQEGRLADLGSGFGAALRSLRRSFSATRVKRAAVYWSVLAILGVGSLAAARAYQQESAGDLFRRLASLPREAVAVERTEDGGTIYVRPLGPAIDTAGAGVRLPAVDNTKMSTVYFAARISGPDCGPGTGRVVLEYQATDRYRDYSSRHFVGVRPGEDSVMFFLAVYSPGEDAFLGLKLTGFDPSCGVELATLGKLEQVELPLTIVLDAGWETRPLFQRMTAEATAAGYFDPSSRRFVTFTPAKRLRTERSGQD